MGYIGVKKASVVGLKPPQKVLPPIPQTKRKNERTSALKTLLQQH